MNELEEIMNGKHEIKHLKIDNDTLTFNTELNNYDWNLTARDIEMIIYILQEDKKNLQSKIDKAIEYCEYNDEDLYTFEPDYDYEENMVDNYEPSSFREDIMEILKEDK